MPSHYLNQCKLIVIGPLETNFSEIEIKIQNVSFMKMHLKMSSVKRLPFCPGGDKLTGSTDDKSCCLVITILYGKAKDVHIQ